mmetsp:Transcript_50859/g.154700  ORF Transcript_50859/g.154700 Transcript_50859/m.154700 type:complete len:271 (-) Transcript_50859:1526-2338(-)
MRTSGTVRLCEAHVEAEGRGEPAQVAAAVLVDAGDALDVICEGLARQLFGRGSGQGGRANLERLLQLGAKPFRSRGGHVDVVRARQDLPREVLRVRRRLALHQLLVEVEALGNRVQIALALLVRLRDRLHVCLLRLGRRVFGRGAPQHRLLPHQVVAQIEPHFLLHRRHFIHNVLAPQQLCRKVSSVLRRIVVQPAEVEAVAPGQEVQVPVGVEPQVFACPEVLVGRLARVRPRGRAPQHRLGARQVPVELLPPRGLRGLLLVGRVLTVQ